MSSPLPPPRITWQPPTAEELQPELPQYEISGLLGRGGMGAVYRARQKSLKREVAIKVLPPMMDDADMHFAERFKAEAESMARLNHPGIIAVYDAGETPGGLLYFVMEFVQGTDVRQMIAASGRLPPAHAHAIAACVCDALAYAHASGLIHRDIKPANIMVDTEGRVKVADFGLVKLMDEDGELTQSNMAVGTPEFVAPEALVPGLPVDARADLYAVGVMLYQMLTGNVPRGAWHPASSMVPEVDPRFDEIIVKAMQLNRDARHSSALEMRAHLDSLLMLAVPAPDAQRHSSAPTTVKSKMRMVTGIGMAAVLVAGAFWMMRGHDIRPPGGNVLKPLAALSPAPMQEGYTNTLGMKFLPIEGTDVMFCIHETRYQDYAAYSADNHGVDSRWINQNGEGITLTENTEQHPVTKVDWENAQKFCQWLGKKEGKTYRLPTDREWSLAVGIGRQEIWEKDTTPATVIRPQNVFPWGLMKWPPPKGAGNFSDASRQAQAPRDSSSYIDSYDDGYPTTAPVMSYLPNTLGIYDISGNVSEWCEDWHDDTQKDRVVRGGSWMSYKRDDLCSSYREHFAPEHIRHNHGFRVVLVTASLSSQPIKPVQTALSTVHPARVLAINSGYTNTLGMKFLPIEGTDVMFCIHETRHQDYAAYAANTPGLDDRWISQNTEGFTLTENEEQHPVTKVGWENAQKFCQWLGKKEGKTYRLPTDREWSIAVGIGGQEHWEKDTTPATVFRPQNVFPWGLKWPPPNDAGNFSDASRQAQAPMDYASYIDSCDDGYPTTAPVMSYPPNALGLYDMGGNVCEWCEDWFDDAKQQRVLRGGDWKNDKRGDLYSSHREHYPPADIFHNHGFRVVLEVESGR